MQKYHRRGKEALHCIPCPVPLTTSSSTQISLLHQMLLVAGLEMESRSRVCPALEPTQPSESTQSDPSSSEGDQPSVCFTITLSVCPSVRLRYYPFPFSYFYMSCALHAILLYPVPFTTPSLSSLHLIWRAQCCACYIRYSYCYTLWWYAHASTHPLSSTSEQYIDYIKLYPHPAPHLPLSLHTVHTFRSAISRPHCWPYPPL